MDSSLSLGYRPGNVVSPPEGLSGASSCTFSEDSQGPSQSIEGRVGSRSVYVLELNWGFPSKLLLAEKQRRLRPKRPVELDEYIESLTDMNGMRAINVGIDGVGRPGMG